MKKSAPRFLDRRKSAALIAAAELVDRTILTVAIYSGLRGGELFGRFWEDIEWSARRITVRRSILGETMSFSRGENSVRHVDVPPSVLTCLEAYRECLPPRPGDLGDFIFRKDNGKPLCAEHWAQGVLPRLCRQAGIRRITLHSLRHTYASLLFNQGADVKYISQQMGRQSSEVTRAVLGHPFERVGGAAIDRLDRQHTALHAARAAIAAALAANKALRARLQEEDHRH